MDGHLFLARAVASSWLHRAQSGDFQIWLVCQSAGLNCPRFDQLKDIPMGGLLITCISIVIVLLVCVAVPLWAFVRHVEACEE